MGAGYKPVSKQVIKMELKELEKYTITRTVQLKEKVGYKGKVNPIIVKIFSYKGRNLEDTVMANLHAFAACVQHKLWPDFARIEWPVATLQGIIEVFPDDEMQKMVVDTIAAHEVCHLGDLTPDNGHTVEFERKMMELGYTELDSLLSRDDYAKLANATRKYMKATILTMVFEKVERKGLSCDLLISLMTEL